MKSVTKILKPYSLWFLMILLFISSCACKKDADKNDVALSSEIGKSESADKSVESDKVEYEITLVEPQDEPTFDTVAAYHMPQTIQEMFCMSAAVVKGTIVDVNEYELSYVASSDSRHDSETFYKSVITLRVEENYSDTELEYEGENEIKFIYPQTSIDCIEGLEYLEENDNIIAVLSRTEKSISGVANLTELALYSCNFMPNCTVYIQSEKSDDKYAAAELMIRAGYEEKKFYKLEDIEKVIEENIEFLEDLSFTEYLEKYRSAE